LIFSGKKRQYNFTQKDFGISFRKVLGPEYVGSLIRENIEDVRLMHCVNETNRCFYMHLGIGLGIHPFALQALFRYAAADVLSRPDDEKCQLFGTSIYDYAFGVCIT
jgi:hypothetical protein